MTENALGVLLRFLREERGLSLREVAQIANIDHAYVHRLETGAKESPSDEALSKLIRALKPGKREAEMVRYLATHPNTAPELVVETLKDPTVTLDVFAGAAGAAFRGIVRPDYRKLIDRVRRILNEEANGG
jgi:HTH-type transcriptional regulator, competence development regulator